MHQERLGDHVPEALPHRPGNGPGPARILVHEQPPPGLRAAARHPLAGRDPSHHGRGVGIDPRVQPPAVVDQVDTAFPGEESLGRGHHHVEELVRIQLDDQLPLEAGERVELPPAGPLSREEVDSPEGGGGLGHEGGGQCEILVREAPRPSGVRGDETDQDLAELERGHQCAGVAGTAETISQGRRQP